MQILLNKISIKDAISSACGGADTFVTKSGTEYKGNVCDEVEHLEQFIVSLPRRLELISDFIILNRTEFQNSMERVFTDFADVKWRLRGIHDVDIPKNILQTVGTERECYYGLVAKRLAELHEISRRQDSLIVDLLVALIHGQRYAEAQVLFHQQNDNSLIPAVLERLLDGAQEDQYFDGPSAFSSILIANEQKMLSYKTWFELMERDSGSPLLLSNGIIIFWKIIMDELSKPNPITDPELLEMKARLDNYKSTVETRWKILIQVGSFQDLLDFIGPSRLHVVGYLVQDGLLQQLVEKSYDDVSETKFLQTLSFVTQLRWNIHKYIGFDQLHKIVTDKQKLLLALRLRETMESLSGPDDPVSALNLLTQLKQTFPTGLQKMLWGSGLCSLKNENRGAYLWCDNSNCFRIAKTCETLFRFQHVIQRDTLEFQVLRFDTKHYLADGGVVDPLKRRGRLQSSQPTNRWDIVALANGDIQLYLQVSGVRGQLMADFNPSSNAVYIWTSDVMIPPTNRWQLECAD